MSMKTLAAKVQYFLV